MNLEKLILGCIINNHSIHDNVIPQLKIEYFPQNQFLADLIISMYKNTKPIDLITVAKRITDKSPIDIIELNKISNTSVADTVNIMSYVEGLKEIYLISQIRLMFGVEINEDPYQFLNDKLKEIEKLQIDSSIFEHRELVDIIHDAQKPDFKGLQCSLSELNKIDPFKPGRLIVLAGRPAHGKTNTSLSWMNDFCSQGFSVLYFSLEMTDVELMRRIGQGAKYEDVSNWNLTIMDRAGVDINYIRSHTRIKKPGVVFIDYLSKIRGGTGEKKTYQIEDNVNLIKNLAKESAIPIILLAQANREIEKRTVKKYEMSDLADSKGIEAEADLVIFAARYELWDMTEYLEGGDTENSVLLQVVKNRHAGGEPNIKTSIDNLLLTDYVANLPF